MQKHKPSNISGTVVGAELNGAYKSKFYVEVVNNGITLKANAEAELTVGNYKVPMTVTLDNGCEITSIVSIRVTQSTPKIRSTGTRTILCRKTLEGKKFICDPVNENIILESISLQNYTDDFLFENGKVSLKKGSTLKGGTYRLKFHLNYKGEAVNTKDITTILTVTVK